MALVIIGGASAASAHPVSSSAVVTTGPCSGPSNWRLRLESVGGLIEAKVKVLTPHAGQAWHFAMFDNDVKFGAGNKTTRADGSWSATRDATDQPNVDNIRVKSRNLVTGETCLPAGFL